MIFAALIFLIGKGVPAWMAIIIIVREVVITGLRLVFASKGTVVSASILGKLKTVAQTIGVLAVILNLNFAWHAMLIAVIFTAISGIHYLVKFSNFIKDRVVNIPNLITLSRLSLIPVFIIYVINNKINIAILAFAIIAAGDKLDGISARLTKQTTEFGSILDSFTDWTFIFTATITFILLKYISLSIGILLIVPVVLVAIAKLYYIKRYKDAGSTAIGKITVGIGNITILTLLIDFAYKNFFLIIVIILVWLTAANFTIKTIRKSEL